MNGSSCAGCPRRASRCWLSSEDSWSPSEYRRLFLGRTDGCPRSTHGCSRKTWLVVFGTGRHKPILSRSCVFWLCVRAAFEVRAIANSEPNGDSAGLPELWRLSSLYTFYMRPAPVSRSIAQTAPSTSFRGVDQGEALLQGALSSRFSCLAVLSEYDHTLTLKLYISIHYVLVLRRAQTLKSWDFKHTNPTSNIICKNVEYNSALFPPSSHTPAFYTYRTSIDPCTLDLKLGIDAKPRLLLLERVIHWWA